MEKRSIKRSCSKKSKVQSNQLDTHNPSNKANFSLINLPQEILVHIFSFYIESEGVANLLQNITKVNPIWEDAANNFKLWPVVDDPKLSRSMLLNLKNQLSRTWKLNISYLEDQLTVEDILSVLPYCPKLKVLNIRTKSLSAKQLQKLPQFCPLLESVTIQCFNISNGDLDPLFTRCGKNLKILDLSENTFTDFLTVMSRLAESCPFIEELHVMAVSGESLIFPFDIFQVFCPKLKVLKLKGVNFPEHWNKNIPGFPDLETLVCHALEETGPNDAVLISMLHASTKLKILDVEDNFEVTCQFLYSVPSDHLETLRLPQADVDIYDVFGAVVKWKHSLRYLSLSLSNETHQFAILFNLVIGPSTCKLEGLDLSNSAVPVSIIDIILRKCPELNYLDLTHCSELPADNRCVYRTREKVESLRRQFKKGLLNFSSPT